MSNSGAHIAISKATILALLLLVGSTIAWSLEGASPATSKALAARIKRVSIRCERHSSIDTCSDAIRWNPSDPLLLVGLADALMRANRPADALRHYQRAAALAPKLPALAAKISAAERRLSSKPPATAVRHKVQAVPRTVAAVSAAVSPPANAAKGKRYSNVDPETQSH